MYVCRLRSWPELLKLVHNQGSLEAKKVGRQAGRLASEEAGNEGALV